MLSNSLVRFSASRAPKTYDVVISGGGMIGSTMALALGKNPSFKDYRIGLVEASPKKVALKNTNEYSNRVSAINPSTKDLFNELGVWKRFNRYQAVSDMKVWGAYTDDTINYRNDSGAKKNVAYIIENDCIVGAVTQELKLLENVDIIYGARISAIETGSSHSPAKVLLNNGEVFHSRLLIGADGANSEVRKVMGVHNLSYSYDQTAVVATLNILEQENRTAWQRFLTTGPIALLPLNNCSSSLVWSTTHEHAKMLLALPTSSFVDAVNEAFNSHPIQDDAVTSVNNILRQIIELPKQRNELPHVCGVVDTSRAAFPLGFGHATNYVKPNIALIGDAAHKVHPLAGQGVNLGFRDVHHLAAALQYGVNCGRQLGDYIDLKTYERKSQCANIPIMVAIDLIYRVYTSQFGLVRALGSVGIQLTEGLSPIKNIMQRVASS